MEEETIKTGDYGKFTDAMSKVDKVNTNLLDCKTQIQQYANNLNDESIFAGPICESCAQEFTKLNSAIENNISNFSTIKGYLDKALVNYLNADTSAIEYLGIKDDKIIINSDPINTISVGNNQDLVSALTAEVGKRQEDYKDSDVGFHTQAWCADFVCYMLRKSGYKCSNWASIAADKGSGAIFDSLRREGAQVHYGEFAKRHGKNVDTNYVPQAGDVCLMNVDNDKSVDHVGFVVKDNGDATITTIEGNTFKNGESYDRGIVEQHIRKKSNIYGYATPVR